MNLFNAIVRHRPRQAVHLHFGDLFRLGRQLKAHGVVRGPRGIAADVHQRRRRYLGRVVHLASRGWRLLRTVRATPSSVRSIRRLRRSTQQLAYDGIRSCIGCTRRIATVKRLEHAYPAAIAIRVRVEYDSSKSGARFSVACGLIDLSCRPTRQSHRFVEAYLTVRGNLVELPAQVPAVVEGSFACGHPPSRAFRLLDHRPTVKIVAQVFEVDSTRPVGSQCFPQWPGHLGEVGGNSPLGHSARRSPCFRIALASSAEDGIYYSSEIEHC